MNAILETIRRRWYLGLPILVVVGFFVYRALARRPPTLNFISPTVEDIEEVIEVSGSVSAQKAAKLKFLGGGKLTYLGIAEGDEVKKGQRVASIDTRDLQRSLKQALNTSNIGRNNLVQGAVNAGDQSYAGSAVRSLSSLQSTLESNVLDVEIKSLAIENSSLYAPFAGVVTALPTNTAGMQLAATDAFEIVDPTTLEFSGEVDEVDIGRVKQGQPVHLTLDAYPQEKLGGQVRSVAMKATASTKASGGTVFLVKIGLPADVYHYRLGMNGTLRIVTRSSKQALTIPLSDLIAREGKSYVRVRTGANVATEREVQAGIESDTKVQIVSGLDATDQVVDAK